MNQWITSTLTAVILFVTVVSNVDAHGYLSLPPSRNYLGTFIGKHKNCDAFAKDDVVTNNNHMALNCGGLWKQTSLGGKCGACGDAFDSDRPHENGRFNSGVITKAYYSGCVLDVKVVLTAAHKGWMEFRLCHDVGSNDLNECFSDPDRSELLEFDSGGTRTTNSLEQSIAYEYKLLIPSWLSCSHCVLQWKYHGGNNWQGPQEEFINCADIAVLQTESDRDPDILQCDDYNWISGDCYPDYNPDDQGQDNGDMDNNGENGVETTTECDNEGGYKGNAGMPGEDYGDAEMAGADDIDYDLQNLVCRLMEAHVASKDDFDKCCHLRCHQPLAELCMEACVTNKLGCPTYCNCHGYMYMC